MNEKLNAYLFELTLKVQTLEHERFTAHAISDALHLNRSTISSYLNQGYRDGLLIKIKSYPVLFLHKAALEELAIFPEKAAYAELTELFKQETKDVLSQVIGAYGSLKEVLDQIKTAVLYPNNGLPILLSGASGSGKTFLAEKIYEYAVAEAVLESNAPFIAYNCAQYFNNPELLSSALFGYRKGAFTGAEQDRSGLLEAADGGVLFLDEVHRLSEEGQEKLFTFMDTGEFSPMGADSKKIKARVRLVFATTENIYNAFLPTFVRRLPVIVNLPKFQNRPRSERIHLIDNFFLNESNILDKELQVSYQLIDFLLNSDLEGNVGKIKNIIKYACGSAYVHQKKQRQIRIRLADLPLETARQFKSQFAKPKKPLADRQYIPRMDLQQQLQTKESQKLAAFFELLMGEFALLNQNYDTPQAFIDTMVGKVTLLMDEFIFQYAYEKEESFYEVLTYNIRETIDFIQGTYGLEQNGDQVVALANYLYIKNNDDLVFYKNRYVQEREALKEFMTVSMNNAYWYAKKIIMHLSQQLDRQIYEEDIIFLTFYFYGLHLSDINLGPKSIVLAHGYSTASSLANVVNRMLNKNIFSAYDMPINITLDKVETQIMRYINDYRRNDGLILLVDMGSFKQLGERLAKKIAGPVLIIDYVSTPLVLAVGSAVLQGKTITEIYEELLLTDGLQKELFVPQVEKKKAIITCCYTGLGSAAQIQTILQKSLGNTAKELVIIPYDYHKLSSNKTYEVPFQLYDVLMIVGTEDPQVGGLPYIGLDRLINGTAVESFVEVLQEHFPLEDQAVKEELIFNFSINKIVENLTILDADKLLRLVQRAVAETEKGLQLQFSNNQLFLLYLHCCCMIERILRKESVDEQQDIEVYLQQEGHTLELIHRCFYEIENEYTIKISNLELRLLNDIIKG